MCVCIWTNSNHHNSPSFFLRFLFSLLTGLESFVHPNLQPHVVGMGLLSWKNCFVEHSSVYGSFVRGFHWSHADFISETQIEIFD